MRPKVERNCMATMQGTHQYSCYGYSRYLAMGVELNCKINFKY